MSTHEVTPSEMRDMYTRIQEIQEMRNMYPRIQEMYTRIQGLGQDTCHGLEYEQLREYEPLNCDKLSHLRIVISSYFNEIL